MPLKRTPPSSSNTTPQVKTRESTEQITSPFTSQNTLAVEQSLHHCTSEPNLAKKSNAPTHNKRKLREHDYDDSLLGDFIKKFEKMFEDFQTKQNQKMDKLCETVDNIREAVQIVEEKLEALTNRVTSLESSKEMDVQYIQTLEDKLELAARSTRATCLEIRNVPHPPKETKTSLFDTFINICNTLNVQVHSHDVRDIFRIKTKDPSNKTVIVDLTSCLLKEKLITSYRKFNKSTSKLSTQHLRINGPPKNIYISENLTPKQKRLFFLARDFANTNNYKFCWTSNGKIFLRQLENAPLVRINNEADLARLKNAK